MERHTLKSTGLLRLKTVSDFELFYKNRGEFNNLEFTLNRIKNAASEACIDDCIADNVVHIAGTNGKGSTAFFIEQILAHRALSTACFTSPHISNIRERIRLNGYDITSEKFDQTFNHLKPLIIKHNLSYFEGLTLIAYKHFKNNMPNVAIIETGLGGRLDSTNILDKKIPVITAISKDHVEYLGDDVFKIADEKLAIIKNNPVVFIGDNSEHMNTYLNDKLHDKTIVRGNYSDENYMGFGSPFANNLRLAKSVSDFIMKGEMPQILKLPKCRGEKINGFVLDGGHNEAALLKIAERFAGKKPVVVFSSTSDRDSALLLKVIETFADKIIITTIPDFERSLDPNLLSTSHIKEKDPLKALKIAVELNKNTDILVCGSLYLCAHVREILTKGLLC